MRDELCFFFDGYRVARSRLYEGNDWKQRFLSRIIRQRFNALQVVQVPRAEQITNLKRNNMGTIKQISIKQIICFNIIAAEKVAGDVCQGLAVKLGKAFIYDNRDIDANEISYISQQCAIALQNISELGLTEAKNKEMNNIIAKYNGNEQ